MKLMDYLPEQYADNAENAVFQSALQKQADTLWAARNDFFLQLDIDTATWGLELWESAYGLETDASKPYEYRRSRILSKLRGQGTVNAEMLRNMAASFADTEVELIEYPERYHFDIKFIGRLGTPPNMSDLTAAVEEIKPAHLTFGYLYRYLLILDIHNKMTLAELEETPLDVLAF